MSELDTVREQCQASGELYEDPEFPAESASLFWDDRSQAGIEWKRPKEICADPKFISENASRHDLDQGNLGNCWYLAACGALTTETTLFTRVCPPDQTFGEGYVGAFHFHFWRFGDWEEVLVDDRLPTRDGKLIFCRNKGDLSEFWSALMEKAYAKLHGSYQALEGGYAIDGLVDFTGGIGEFIDLRKEINKDKLWRRLRAMDRMNSFMCAAIESDGDKPLETELDNGLLTSHVYSITKIHQITRGEETVRLIRLRNPWGKKEWNGAWGDGSAEWNDVSAEEREALGLVNENEGEFWMAYQDWVTNFHNLQICHLEAQSMKWKREQSEWNVQSHHGAWRSGVNAGGCGMPPNEDTYWSNPQYYVEIEGTERDAEGESTLVVSIMQKYSRLKKTLDRTDRTEEAVGVDLYKLLSDKPDDLAGFHADPSALQLIEKMYDYEYFRERSRKFDLERVAGVYCVIPMTYAPDTEGEFLLRVLSELPMQSGEIVGDEEAEGDKPSKFTQLFSKLSGDDGVIDARELKKMVNQGLKREQDDEFSRESCRALIQTVTGDRKGTLDQGQCKRVWRQVRNYQQTFDKYDVDASGLLDIKELRKAFKSLGHTLSKKALSTIAEKYCAKSENLTLDEFILCVEKVTSTNDAFNSRGGRNRKKVELSKEEMLELALS